MQHLFIQNGSNAFYPKSINTYTMENKIRELRKKHGFTLERLADAVGTNIAQIQKLEVGERRLTVDWMRRISLALGCNPEDLISDSEPKQVPIVGEIGAGERFYPIDDHAHGNGLEMVDSPENCENCVAVRIRGDSMKPFKAGWLVFYERYADGVPPECMHELCVVKLDDECMMLKVVKPGSLPYHYHLISFNEAYKPILDQKLLWASKVKDIRPS